MLDKDQIFGLLKSFYTVTGIKVVVFDALFNEIIAYPSGHCGFCDLVKKTNGDRCKKSEAEFCNKAKSLMNLYTGRCHAGLIEAVIPITDHHLVVGYIMFGQLRMEGDNNPENMPRELYDGVTAKSSQELGACTDILRALGRYIMTGSSKPTVRNITGLTVAEYISENLSRDLSIDNLCKKFGVSRSKLYALTEPYMPSGIAAYIKETRLDKAAELLTEGTHSVHSVAETVGYSDYNYFCKDFKRRFTISAKEYAICNKTK